jgi:hypothetical protein
MTLYKDYIEVNSDFIPVFNAEVDRKEPATWKFFIPHQSLKEVLNEIIKSIERASNANCKPIWMSGAYGTGKTFASFVVKHLLEDDIKSVEEYFNSYPIIQPLYQHFRSIRESEKILVVYRSSSSNITTAERLLIEVQQSVKKALENGGCTYLGGRTAYESILRRLTDENSTFNFKAAFEKYRLDFGEYSSYEHVIADLKNENDYKLVETVARVMEREGFAYFDGVEDIKDWLEDIIKGNNLKAIVFIWDEFTDYFRQNRTVSTLQELAHVSSRMPFYLFLITHRAIEQFNLDSDARRVLQDRFKMIKFQMSEVTAYQLMANAIKIKPQAKDEWDTKAVTLWDEVERCARRLKEHSEGLKIEELINLIPLHPFSAYLLSIISKQFSSNQRTMFQFLKEDPSQQEQGIKNNFNWFIQNHSFEGWHWLTADFLWDYFFKADNEDLPDEVRTLINYYNSHCNELTGDELSVFKCALLLIAINRQLGAEKLLKPLQSNLEMIFMGTPIYQNLKNILDELCEKDLLNSVHSSANDREFVVPMMSYDKNKLDKIQRQIESQYTFEKCVESRGVIGERFQNVYKLSGALDIRFVTKTAPLQNLKIRINRFQDELEPYSIGVLFVIVKSDADLVKVDQAIKEIKSEGSRVILVNVNQPFGEREWKNWLDAKTKEAYAREMNDGSNARYYKDNAERFIDNWIKKVEVTTMTACFRGEYYQFTELSGLREYLEKISAQVYPYGPETVCKIDNLYKPFGYSKDAVLMGMGVKNYRRPYSNIVESLQNKGFWHDSNTFALYPTHPVSMMKQKVKELIETSNSVYVLDIWNELMQAPFGFAPSPVAAFLFGFLMKEYAENGGYYKDDGSNAVPLSHEGLADVIESVMKGMRNHENYSIAKMKPEHEFFCNTLQDAFKFTKEQASCPRDIKKNIRRFLTEKKYPLWSLKYYLPDQKIADVDITSKLNEVINLICDFISAEGETDELQIAEKVAEILSAWNSVKALLPQIIDVENFKKGMNHYIDNTAPNVLILAEKSGIDFNQIIDEIRNRMTEDAHWLWKEDNLQDVLESIENEYRLLNSMNEFIGYTSTSIKDALRRIKEIFENVKLPWVVIRDYAGNVKDTLELLIGFVYLDSSNINMRDLALRLDEHRDGIGNVLNNLEEIFGKYLQSISDVNVSSEQISEIYNKLPKSAINNDIERFKQVVKNLLNNLRVNHLMQRLKKLWQEISGTPSPREWSRKSGVPILWLPGITPSVFLNTFNVINNGQTQDHLQIENAIAILEQKKEHFVILHDAEKINEAFINKAAGDYAYLVRNNINADSIRSEIIKHFGEEIYDWWLKQDDISKHVQNYLAETYRQETYKEVLQKIDELSAQEAKEYLKELIRKEPLVGIKILKKK